MGKLKRRVKNQKARLNPIKRDTSKDENLRQTKILPLIEKLKSSVPNDKAMAVGAIGVLCEDAHMRQLLLKEKLIATVMERCLNDSNDEILVESFGLLRNVGIEEGYDVLIYLWRSNIWASIEAALDKINTSFSYLFENTPKDKSKLQLLYDFTENVLSLVDTLACGSEELHANVLQKMGPVISIVTKLIQNQLGDSKFKVSNQLFVSLLAFIYEMSVESNEFIEMANFDFAAVEKYVEPLSQAPWGRLAAVYIEAIKFNNLEMAGVPVDVGASISKVCSLVGAVDLEDLKSRIVKERNPDNAKPQVANDSSIVAELNKQAQEKNHTKYELTTIEVSLDLISSLLEYTASQDSDISVVQPVYEMILMLMDFEHNNSVLRLHNKMVVAMNNFVWLFVTRESGFDCSALWGALKQIQSSDMELQKNCLNALSGCFRLHDFSRDSLDMVDPLIARATDIKDSQDEEALLLYQAIVEFLGLATSSVEEVSVASKVGPFLFSSAELYVAKDDPLAMEIVLTALDLVFDVFGCDKVQYDQLYVSENLNARLIEIEKALKTAYKKIDKNKYANLKARAEEVWGNVRRFIQYKE